jgi:hypothetical protein
VAVIDAAWHDAAGIKHAQKAKRTRKREEIEEEKI